MSNKIGIWMDKRVAKIVGLGVKDTFQIIHSNIEEYHPKGGSGSKFKGGPQDVVQDGKYLARKKQQYRTFFKNVAESIKDAESLVIIGPAQTSAKFYKELALSYPKLHKKVSRVEKADSMTDNQMIAWVKNYYSKLI